MTNCSATIECGFSDDYLNSQRLWSPSKNVADHVFTLDVIASVWITVAFAERSGRNSDAEAAPIDLTASDPCAIYNITTNQAAIIVQRSPSTSNDDDHPLGSLGPADHRRTRQDWRIFGARKSMVAVTGGASSILRSTEGLDDLIHAKSATSCTVA